MSSSEIIEFYDQNPDVTLRQLSAMTGKSIAYLKGLLMPPKEYLQDNTSVAGYTLDGRVVYANY